MLSTQADPLLCLCLSNSSRQNTSSSSAYREEGEIKNRKRASSQPLNKTPEEDSLFHSSMAFVTGHHPLAFAFGLLGNLVSFMVYLAPLPTFYRVYKRKSTEGFHSVPYIVALFSATLWLYYSFIKPHGSMLMTINSISCVIEGSYIVVYLIYAPRPAKMFTIKLLFILNVGIYGLILALTFLLSKGSQRVTIVGWICSAFAVGVLAAPLSIIRLVIKTKSVEYMPFTLPLFLTICTIMWFFYGLLMKDPYVAFPNILGFTFGVAQIVLYIFYKDAGSVVVVSEIQLPELQPEVVPEINLKDDEPKPQHVNTQYVNAAAKETVTVNMLTLNMFSLHLRHTQARSWPRAGRAQARGPKKKLNRNRRKERR